MQHAARLGDVRAKRGILDQFKSAKRCLHALVNQPDMQTITIQNAWIRIKVVEGHIIPDVLNCIYIFL